MVPALGIPSAIGHFHYLNLLDGKEGIMNLFDHRGLAGKIKE